MANHTTSPNGTDAGGSGGARDWLADAWPSDQTLARLALEFALFVAVVLLGYVVGRLLRYSMTRIHRGVVPTSGRILLSKMLHFAAIVVAVGVGLSAAYGVDPVGMMATLGLVSLALGFGLQSTVANLAGGVSLTVDKPFDVGDRIRVEDTWGDVVSIGLRSTRIVTTSGEHVVIPNQMLDTEAVWNYTHRESRKMRVEIPIGISYQSSMELAERLCLQAARDTGGVQVYPEPFVVFKAFGSSSVDFELRCWIDRAEDRSRITDKLLRAIKRAFDEHGVAIPFPQRTLTYLSDLPAPAETPEMRDTTREPMPVVLVCLQAIPADPETARRVMDFVGRLDARLVIAHVRPGTRAADQDRAQEAVNTYLKRARAQGVPAEGRTEVGDVTKVLRRLARETNASLVVVGHHARSRFQWMHDDVRSMRRASPVPVLVIQSEEAATDRIVDYWKQQLHDGEDAKE